MSKSDSEESVILVAKLLNVQIKNHQTQMPWLPKEDLKADKVTLYILDLVNKFLTVLILGQSLLQNEKSKAEKKLRLKDSFAQDIVFCYKWSYQHS